METKEGGIAPRPYVSLGSDREVEKMKVRGLYPARRLSVNSYG